MRYLIFEHVGRNNVPYVYLLNTLNNSMFEAAASGSHTIIDQETNQVLSENGTWRRIASGNMKTERPPFIEL